METLQGEIQQAAQRLDLEPAQFHALSDNATRHVVLSAEEHFVALRGQRWWWTAFRCRGYLTVFTDQYQYRRLSSIIPVDEALVWLITNIDAAGAPLAYEGTAGAIQAVLGECYFFEYYVVSRAYKWLVCETHHNAMIAVGFSAIRRLKTYVHQHPEEVSSAKAYTVSK